MWWVLGICLGFSLFLLRRNFVLGNYSKMVEECGIADIQKLWDEKKLPLCFVEAGGVGEKNDYFVLFTPNGKFLKRKALILGLEKGEIFSLGKKYLFRLDKTFVLGRIREGKVIERIVF
jgi:hypothetical protein